MFIWVKKTINRDLIITARNRRMGTVMFSQVCVSSQGGVPQSQDPRFFPRSFPKRGGGVHQSQPGEGIPVLARGNSSLGQRASPVLAVVVGGGGYPSPSQGYPSASLGVHQSQLGVPKDRGTPWLGQGWGTPWPGQDWGTPPARTGLSTP